MAPAHRGGSRLGLDLWDVVRHLASFLVASLAWALVGPRAGRSMRGGRLQIESRLGAGTTVTVTLPSSELPSPA
ncbi:MAG: ATP-binding protein [Deltaproteobacteria bacterium]|nr:ATP-binding protein [Deltaproteobacteria bacterium]